VTVDLPVGTCDGVVVRFAPLANGVVRGAEAAIGSEMRDRRYVSRRCRGAHHLPVLGEGSMKLDAHFEANGAIPIDGDVTSVPHLLRPDGIPDQPTALRHDARELSRTRLTPNDGERDTWESSDLDGVRRHDAIHTPALQSLEGWI